MKVVDEILFYVDNENAIKDIESELKKLSNSGERIRKLLLKWILLHLTN